MSKKIVVRSAIDRHVLFSSFKAYYSDTALGRQVSSDHRHPDPEISAIMGGSGVYTCAGEDIPFRQGDIFFHCGSAPHCFTRIDDSSNLSLVVLRFDPRLIWSTSGEWASPLFLRLFSPDLVLRRTIPHDAPAARAIYDLLVHVFEECRTQGPAYDAFVKAALLAMLAHLARHFDTELQQHKAPGLNPVHIKKLEESMNWIHAHLDTPLTLNDLAARACMSRSYYSAIFKSLNGVSVGEYITCQRIDRAKYKLLNTGHPILEIAECCGFNSIANFNRSFKLHTGMTPGEYRSRTSDLSYLSI